MDSAIRDQRTMVGFGRHATIDEVRDAWHDIASSKGVTPRKTRLKSPVYISAGCLVADCPNPDCNGAAAVWEENPEACCLDCGTIFTPSWPTKKQLGGTMDEAVRILGLRPREQWRHFRASNPDETIADLKAQNLAMGDAIPGGKPARGPHPLDPNLVRS